MVRPVPGLNYKKELEEARITPEELLQRTI